MKVGSRVIYAFTCLSWTSWLTLFQAKPVLQRRWKPSVHAISLHVTERVAGSETR